MMSATVQTPSAEATGPSGPSWLRRLRSNGIVVSLVIVFVLLALSSRAFLRPSNLLNILDQQAPLLIMAAAGTLVLIAGGIDLSIGAVYGLAGVVAAQVTIATSTPVGLVVGLAAGLLVGLFNGVAVTVFKVNALIATLASAFIIRGLAAAITKGSLITLFDDRSFSWLGRHEVLGVEVAVWLAAVVVVVLGLVLKRSVLGRHLYAVGGSDEAARLAGIGVRSTRVWTYVLSGGAAALAGIIVASKVSSAQADAGSGLEFTVLAGIIVGGTSILGGAGAVWRSVVGVLFIALIGNGFNLLGLDPLYQQMILGVILLAAVAYDTWSRNRGS